MATQFNGFLVTKTDGTYLDTTAAVLFKHIVNGGVAFIQSYSNDALIGADVGIMLITDANYNGRVYTFYYTTDEGSKYYDAASGDAFPMYHDE